MFYSFVTKHACDGQTVGRTEGQTDGQNYDPQDCASIAASHGKNQIRLLCVTLVITCEGGYFVVWFCAGLILYFC